ncbi:hypothetical protein WH95_01735 [Kiloniella litopenaei]|uniref:Uncharacterized protein n=1 Tax=Kiloniella litopenaei TaxID=1549748 RepID=A0A0M2R8U2_9PROT|nr:hypothetical protein [Kiloniella litopenaei]KKJ78101.1 hypothetical protein WH95_01735 [Kiloniella litopenaei]
MTAYTFYPFNENLPVPWDVLWCWFPYLPDTVPGPKNRPCIVRDVLRDPETDEVYVEVCYGTSRTEKNRPYCFYVCNSSDMDDAGLPQQTMFHLYETAILPWCHEYFTPQEDGFGPIVGKIPKRCRDQVAFLEEMIENPEILQKMIELWKSIESSKRK